MSDSRLCYEGVPGAVDPGLAEVDTPTTTSGHHGLVDTESVSSPPPPRPATDSDLNCVLVDKVIPDKRLFPDIEMSEPGSEISRVLENFNAILDNIELEEVELDFDPAGLTQGQKEYIANTMEAFSELLIGGEGDGRSANDLQEKDLLIVVDDNSSDSDEENGSGNNSLGAEVTEEGYESDRPMVRASMRKLRPVTMVPMPGNQLQGPVIPVTPMTYANCSVTHVTPTTVSPVYSNVPTSPVTTVTPAYANVPQAFGHGPLTSSLSSGSSSGHSVLRVTSLMNTVLVSASEPPSLEDNNAIVLDIEEGQSEIYNGTPVAPAHYNSTAQFQVSSSSSSGNDSSSGPSEGCATFRPAANLVFRNLHHHPAEIAEVVGALSENGAGTEGTEPAPSTGTRSHRRSTGTGPSLRVPSGRWPHRLSSVLALIGCTLGLNNICRFGLLSVQYGANFTLQFVFLSLVFGIPLFTFHMSIGQYLSAGIIDMWKISPIFQGIGIGLVISQAMIGIYTAVGVSWMFIYFRDSFITRYDQYRWGKCFRDYRTCDHYQYNSTQLAETVPDYFNGVVLQRSSPEYPSPAYVPSSLKFTVAFNLAVVWMLVFVSLSKGLKSYGKVIHGFVLIPITSMLVLSSKMVGLVPTDDTGSLFGQTDWSNFFFNSQTWVIAAREVFFTWGLLGACVMQITSHNRFTHSLKSDASIVVVITTFVLLLTTLLGNSCYNVLLAYGYDYVPSSFESEQSYKFLVRRSPDNLPLAASNYGNTYTSFLMGVRIARPEMGHNPQSGSHHNTVSGYQALRLATELFPATMALLGSQGLSPFWTVLFYFTFILFGLAQQLTIWYCVIKGVIAIKAKVLKSWETTITFCVCALGFVLGLPLCTEFGIFVEYFLDYTIGSGWWIMVLYLLQLVAVFIVRGAPYCGENIVTVLFTGPGKLTAFLAPLLSFIWNVILPVAILVLSIASFKSGNIRELYDWNPTHGYVFWPSWTRELGSLLQLLPLLTVPFVAIVQTCRYLTNGRSDLFDRMQELYRPQSRGLLGGSLGPAGGRNGSTTDFPSRGPSPNRPNEDPPPKYTPPPSYSTATGARIAKFLRASFRRSMRRFSGPSPSTSSESLPPPPNYASVVLETSAQRPDCYAGPSNPSGACEAGTSPHSLVPILISPPTEDSEAPATRRTFEVNLTQSAALQGAGSDLASREKVNLRRMTSDVTPREVARLLRANLRLDSPQAQRQNSVDLGLGLDPEGRTENHGRTCSIPRNHNFDFSSRTGRNRRNNDSQLALLSFSGGSRENLNYFGLMSLNMSLGIINPAFQLPPVAGPSGSTNSARRERTNSLSVPSNFSHFP